MQCKVMICMMYVMYCEYWIDVKGVDYTSPHIDLVAVEYSANLLMPSSFLATSVELPCQCGDNVKHLHHPLVTTSQ